MAARKTLWTPEIVRQRIQTSQLVNRLSAHALGKVKMSSTQVRAAEVLLRKAVPDLSSLDLSGEVGHRHIDVTANPLPPDDWDKQYSQPN